MISTASPGFVSGLGLVTVEGTNKGKHGVASASPVRVKELNGVEEDEVKN